MTDMVERFDKAALDWGWTQDCGTRGEEIQRSRSEYESAKAALIGEIKRQRADIASLTASLAAEVSESERLRSELAALRQQVPVAYLFQHEETGIMQCVDVQQVEWGFEENNPRLQNCGPLYAAPVHASASASASEVRNQALEDAAQEAIRENERCLALASIRIPAMAEEIASAIRAMKDKADD